MLESNPLYTLNSNCWHPGGLSLTSHALKLCPLPLKAILLDIGCGLGQSTSFLREQGYLAYGMDIKKFKTTTTLNNVKYPNFYASATQLPCKTASFDGVICECVLSLLANQRLALQEFWRVCKTQSQQGFLLLSDLYNKNPASEGKHFTRNQLEKNLHNAGWCVQCFEDHSVSLKNFVAQLVWHNNQTQNLKLKDYGYGLWIAKKE